MAAAAELCCYHSDVGPALGAETHLILGRRRLLNRTATSTPFTERTKLMKFSVSSANVPLAR